MSQTKDIVKREASEVTASTGTVPSLFHSPEATYLRLAVLVATFAIGGYCLFEYARQGLVEYIVGAGVNALFFVLFALSLSYNPKSDCIDPPALPPVLMNHRLYSRYLQVSSDLKALEAAKGRLFPLSLKTQLEELIEDRLYQILSRQENYKAFWKKCDYPKLERHIADLQASLGSESDEDILRALKRNLEIALGTKENYDKIEKALTLFDLQISTIEQHIENLNTKLHIMDIDADTDDRAKDLIDEINSDINDIEDTLSSMELPLDVDH